MAREVEEESGDLEPSSLSVELREGGCLHIVSLCVSSPEARSKLLLTRGDGWRPFYSMGGYGSKDNVVADSIDNSTNLSKEYAMLKLHGGTWRSLLGPQLLRSSSTSSTRSSAGNVPG